jgi:hypothetical protein
MNAPARVTLFGACSGLLWSAVAIFWSARSAEVWAVYPIIGIITGLLVSFALYKPLLGFRTGLVPILGILALPLGTFCFGACSGLAFALLNLHPGGTVTFGDIVFGPIYAGFLYTYAAMVICFFSLYGLILFPSAVITTYLLRLTISRGRQAARPLDIGRGQ